MLKINIKHLNVISRIINLLFWDISRPYLGFSFQRISIVYYLTPYICQISVIFYRDSVKFSMKVSVNSIKFSCKLIS